MESEIDMVIAKQNYIASELNRLQKLYEKKMAEFDKHPMIPPPIKTELLKVITDKMDKLEAMYNE